MADNRGWIICAFAPVHWQDCNVPLRGSFHRLQRSMCFPLEMDWVREILDTHPVRYRLQLAQYWLWLWWSRVHCSTRGGQCKPIDWPGPINLYSDLNWHKQSSWRLYRTPSLQPEDKPGSITNTWMRGSFTFWGNFIILTIKLRRSPRISWWNWRC